MLVSNPIDALYNGVSQQPANMRLPSQCAEQINGLSSVADGLTKRPPTEYIAKVGNAESMDDAFIHIIDRDPSNQYVVIIDDTQTLQVRSLADGTAETVVMELYEAWAATHAYVVDDLVVPSTPNGFAYRCTTAGTSGGTEPTWGTTLGGTTNDGTAVFTAIPHYLSVPAGDTARETFRVVTVGDYSFIVNKSVVVQTYSTGTAQRNRFNSWFFPDFWKKTEGDDTRFYIPSLGTDMGKVQTLADLPTPEDTSPPSEGDYYEIAGNDDSGFSRYYVIYKNGVWTETHQGGSSITLDEATMPLALVHEADLNFHVREFGWIPRLFGDDLTNPEPSFVGRAISDVAYHKNRLAFASGENVIFSCAGDFGNFFRNTVAQLLDSDVVDVAVSTKSVSNIEHIIPAENSLMMFSRDAQFQLNVDQLLTPSTVSVDVTTNYEMNSECQPVAIGQDVYFVTENGNYSRVREYAVADNDDVLNTDATDITAHVPRYLPKNITRLAGSANDDIIVALSSELNQDHRLFVYKTFYSGGEKIQSAWSKWDLHTLDKILTVAVLNSNIYLLVDRIDGVYLEKINIQESIFPAALDFNIYLDHRYQFTAPDKQYTGGGSDWTTFTFPYQINVSEQSDFRLVQLDGAEAGRVLDPTQYTFVGVDAIRFPGNWTSVEVMGGANYTFEYTFSQQFNRRQDGMSVTTGNYQLRTFNVVYENMAAFSTHVDPYGNDDGLTEDIVTAGLSDFTGKTLGHTSLTLGTPNFEDGSYSFQIYGNSKDAIVKLVMDQPFGGSFVSCTVEGYYTNRSR